MSSAIVQQLVKAVNTAMNPSVDHQKRLDAYQVCEEFKEKSPECAACGIELVGLHHSPVIRHFGLQLLEHCVKFRWNSMGPEDKVTFKETVMRLLSTGTLDILNEQLYIKDGLSRIVVEMVKREWPQNWPTLLSELNCLCGQGEIQTELVLLMFLRLAEDVVAFQTLQSQRRRDVQQALTANMSELFSFLLALLKTHTTQYHLMMNASTDAEKTKAMAHCRVAQAVLMAFTGYAEWAHISNITAQDNALLQSLCLLLNDKELKEGAAEVLQMIVNRKGKVEERKPLLVLFSEDAMSLILRAAESAAAEGMDERNYVFLKHLCQVLTGLGSQLFVLWGAESTDVGQPTNFNKYLQAILAFTQHPSIYLKDLTQPLWSSFFRHDIISQDALVLSAIPSFLTTAMKNLTKYGFPSQDNHPSCAYSRLDFDTDEEFNHFFNLFRAHQIESIRFCNRIKPLISFDLAKQWLRQQLSAPTDSNTPCSLHSQVYLDWDAMTCFVECVMQKVFLLEIPPIAECTELLSQVLSYQVQDPLLLSCALTCVSSLFPVMKYSTQLLPRVLHRLFDCVVFSLPGQTKTRSRPVQNPFFDEIYDKVKNLSTDLEELTQLEKITLLEALILLSNEVKNFEQQKAFIDEIALPIQQIWLSDTMKMAFSSAINFIHHIGLDTQPVAPSTEDVVGVNRSNIVYCINTILAMLKRSRWPSDLEEARVGGFVSGQLKNDVPVLKNPCMSAASVLLDNVFSLIRTFNHLWLPEMRAKLSPEYSKVYDMQEHEKLAALGINTAYLSGETAAEVPVNKSPVERMHNFIAINHDNCYHILANAGLCLGYEYYTVPKLTQVILNSIFVNMEHIPDHRLRPIIRVFMKSFTQYCPSECHSTVLVPILYQLCSFLITKLSAKWEVIRKRSETSTEKDNDDDQESQEVLEDQMTRLLTRDYIDLLTLLFRAGKTAESSVTMDMGGEDEMDTIATVGDDKATVSELGKCLLEDQSLCEILLMSTFSPLAWADTTTCMKAVNICKLVLQLVVSKPLPADASTQLFVMVLCGLQVHGQHDACQAALVGLAFEAYCAMRPMYEEIASVLLQIPDCSYDNVKKFDDRFILMNAANKPVSEKRKKDAFKKLISGVIGQALGEQFKRHVHIRDLPPLFKSTKRRLRPVLEQDSTEAGLVSLFSGN
uniref:Exportin-5-like n=1 Tax=Saccoglossus kowalevskii TaxID=10224 RepID=A0ABM0LUU5_SACKO|nr:PREDICTED: exportin-5-like [Saccoglossus kowalevskii]